MKIKLHQYLLAGGAALVGMPCTAQTSEADGLNYPEQTSDAPAQGYNEIIVTARKRAESLQSVPLAVTAVDASAIDRNRIVSVDQVARLTPNVDFNAAGSVVGTVNMYIRGIGARETEISQDSPIALSIDGVYIPTAAGSLIDVYDVQQIEVLRGPQGTLQGRNATGGAINVVTARPTGEFDGKLALSYGRFEEVNIKGVVNIPIVEDLFSGKMSAFFNDGGNYMRNTVYDGLRTAGGLTNWGGRIGLLFTPSDSFDAYLTADYVRNKSPQPPARSTEHAGSLVSEVSGVTEFESITCRIYGHCAPVGKYEVQSDFIEPQTSKNGGAGLTMNWNLGGAVLTSVSGFRFVNEHVSLDNDRTPDLIVHIVNRTTRYRSWSEELRIASDSDGPLSYVAGVYLSTTKATLVQPTITGGALRGLPNEMTRITTPRRQQRATSYAAFAQLNYDITDALKATAGARVTRDEKRLTAQPGGEPDRSGTFNANFTEPTFEAGVQYTFGPDYLAYFRFAQGYRSGGLNGTVAFLADITPYFPETVNSYEIGLKTQWLNRRLTVNIAGFYYNYDDMQIAENSVAAGTGATITLVKNAGTAKIWGLELEGNYQADDSFSFYWALGYLDTRYGHQLINLGHGVFDLADIPLARTPKISGTVGADYRIQLGQNDGSVTLGADVTFKTRHYTNPEPLPNAEQKAYALLNASITYRTEDEKYFISLWGENLTNQYYHTQAEDGSGQYLWQLVGRPRTYGVRVGAEF